MGHKYTKQEILDHAVSLVLDTNLSTLSFGRVAKEFGGSDRMVVYYFPRKEDLITAVMQQIGAQMQATLVQTVPESARTHLDMGRATWPTLNRPETRRVFTLFFEANGLAAAGIQPYAQLIPAMIEAWIEWVASVLEGPSAQRRREAEATVALLDGLMLFRQTAGDKAAQRAAVQLGIA